MLRTWICSQHPWNWDGSACYDVGEACNKILAIPSRNGEPRLDPPTAKGFLLPRIRQLLYDREKQLRKPSTINGGDVTYKIAHNGSIFHAIQPGAGSGLGVIQAEKFQDQSYSVVLDALGRLNLGIDCDPVVAQVNALVTGPSRLVSHQVLIDDLTYE